MACDNSIRIIEIITNPAHDMSNLTITRQIDDLIKPGDHLCSFYETKLEQFQIVLPFLATGLAKGEKCLYIADENTAAEIKAGLFMHGVDMERYLRSSQLKIITAKESYLRLGRFDPDAMISFLTLAVREAVKEGYQCLRVAAEASWTMRELSNLDVFIKYEAMVDAVIKGLPTKILCQYNVKMFLGSIVVKVLKSHPRVLMGLDLYENPFHKQVMLP